MKKKLLFTLLLGSAFAWVNEIYAADVAEHGAAAGEHVGESAAEEKSVPKEEEKKYTVPTVVNGKLGEKIDITYFEQGSEDICSKVTVLDGGVTQADTDEKRKMPGRHNYPYVPGQSLGDFKIINIFVKIDPKGSKEGLLTQKKISDDPGEVAIADFDREKGDANWVAPDGYDIDNEHAWMLMDEHNRIFMAKLVQDPNAEEFIGKDSPLYPSALARIFNLPDSEATQKLLDAKKAAKEAQAKADELQLKLEEAAKNGGSAASDAALEALKADLEKAKEELAKAKEAAASGASAPAASAAPVAVDASLPLMKTFEFEGMKFRLSSNNKSHEDKFEQLVASIEALFSAYPKVAAALVAEMFTNDASDRGFRQVKLSDIYKLPDGSALGQSAVLEFESGISVSDAWAYSQRLKEKFNVPTPEEAAEQAKAKLASETAKKDAELAALRAEAEQAKAALEAALKVAAEAIDKADEEKINALRQADAAAQSKLEAAQSAAVAEQALGAAEQHKAEADKANSEIEQVLTEAEKLAKEKSEADEAAAKAEAEKHAAELEAEALKSRLAGSAAASAAPAAEVKPDDAQHTEAVAASPAPSANEAPASAAPAAEVKPDEAAQHTEAVVSVPAPAPAPAQSITVDEKGAEPITEATLKEKPPIPVSSSLIVPKALENAAAPVTGVVSPDAAGHAAAPAA